MNKEKYHFFQIACDKYVKKPNQNIQGGIGQRVTRKNSIRPKQIDCDVEMCIVEAFDLKINGLALCFDKFDAYYVSFDDIKNHSEMNDTLAPSTQDHSITLNEKIDILNSILKDAKPKQIHIFDFKTFSKLTHLGLDIPIIQYKNIKFFDPKVASWMLKPSGDEKDEMNLNKLIINFKPELVGLLELLGPSSGKSSVAMNPQSR